MRKESNIADALGHIEQLLAAGQFQAAESACLQLAQLVPEREETWVFLGLIALHSARLQDAESAFRKVVAIKPDEAGYWHNLSVVLREQGRSAEAEGCVRRALEIDASQPALWLTLGNTLHNQSRWSDAVVAYRRSLELDGNNPTAWCNLGATEERLQRPAAAAEAYERSLALAPNDVSALSNYAMLLTQRGQPERASELLQRLVKQQPRSSEAWSALGSALQLMGDAPQAEAAYRNALAISPQHREARYNLAFLLMKGGALAEAEACIRPLLAEAGNAEAWSLLGMLLLQGRQEEALAAMRRSIAFDPHPDRHSVMLASLNYVEDSAKVLLDAACAWDVAYARQITIAAPSSTCRNGERPLRIGFVSADFGMHPTGFLVLPTIERMDKQKCSVVCYSDRQGDDVFTSRFRAAAELWRETTGFSHAELAEQIRSDEIDVLVDLMGHAGKRLLTFAHRPAPLQVTWFGYVGTTGMAAMDCLLADSFHIQPDEEQFYVERVLRMPNGYACYEPFSDAWEVGELPALANGYVTFGCFNNPAKFSPIALAGWSEILLRVPTAKLHLKYGGLEQPSLQELFRQKFAQCGVAASRILFEGRSSLREHLAAYGRVDIALDTQPYSGGLTTCEALWMGVPVVTWPGKTFAGRHSVSHLTNAGYPEFVAADREGYVELAVEWANRLEELAAVRATMRERVRQSPLCDAERFARDFLEVMRRAWEEQVGV